MALPVLPKSKHTLKSPFIPGGNLVFTPFTIGQQSILIAVKDSKDASEKINAIKQIVDECIVTENINVDALPVFIVELLFLKMRQHSLGDELKFQYTCNNEVLKSTSGEEIYGACNTPVEVSTDLSSVGLKTYKEHTLTVNITEEIGVKLKYPTMQTAEEIKDNKDETELVIRCIDMVFDGEDVTNAKDCTFEQLKEFFNGFTLAQQKNIYTAFVASMPHIYLEKKVTCPSCKKEHTVKFSSLLDFFQ